MSPDPRPWLLEHLRTSFGMTDEDAHAVSDMVLDLFDAQHELDDDTITPDIRSLLYELEARRIVTARRFEYQEAETGRILRGFIWSLNLDLPVPVPKAPEHPEESCYAELPAGAWSRGTPA